MNSKLILNECPRDAMQGLSYFVPTDIKIRYLNALLEVGFSRLDFGSFVNPKAIPQLRDTSEVVGKLNLSSSCTKLLAIVANLKGAEQAVEFDEIQFLGFPLSVSENFQQRNTNKSISVALEEVARIQNLCLVRGKNLVVYLSMAFGNPYKEEYSPEIVLSLGQRVVDLGVKYISVSDTVGLALPQEVESLFRYIFSYWSQIEITAHLHANPDKTKPKIAAAWAGGCRAFDVALGGYGGCPMAEDELVGNIGTELMLDWAIENNISSGLKLDKLKVASDMLIEVFH